MQKKNFKKSWAFFSAGERRDSITYLQGREDVVEGVWLLLWKENVGPRNSKVMCMHVHAAER